MDWDRYGPSHEDPKTRYVFSAIPQEKASRCDIITEKYDVWIRGNKFVTTMFGETRFLVGDRKIGLERINYVCSSSNCDQYVEIQKNGNIFQGGVRPLLTDIRSKTDIQYDDKILHLPEFMAAFAAFVEFAILHWKYYKHDIPLKFGIFIEDAWATQCDGNYSTEEHVFITKLLKNTDGVATPVHKTRMLNGFATDLANAYQMMDSCCFDLDGQAIQQDMTEYNKT